MRCLIPAMIGCVLACPVAACETALLLAVDVSGSIGMDEYHLQMQGVADALADPDVIAAIVDGHDAVALVHWSGKGYQQLSLDWQKPGSAVDVAALAQRIATLRRPQVYTFTAIGEAVRYSQGQFAAVPDCQRKVIDVSGDGVENEGWTLPDMRAAAERAGITINGVAIELDAHSEKLTGYYRQSVMTRDGFVITAKGLQDYPRAIHDKLLRELTKAIS